MNQPTKKLKDFAKQYGLSWEELDFIIMQCESEELDILNTSEDPKEIRKILTKYHS